VVGVAEFLRLRPPGDRENADGDTGPQDRPAENGDKYRTQEGFLFTNSVYIWMMTDVFKLPIAESPPAN